MFGATILQGSVPRSRPAEVINLYNKKGIFSNVADTIEDLETALGERFSDVKVELRERVALFEATAD